jgi:hypothetical protein
VLSILVGLGLAAATGFRVFVPFLVLSLAARGGHVELASGFDWIASDAALVTFAVATGLEILAYFIPWLDNLLDSVATPAAVVAGIVLTASAAVELSPWLRWSLAVLAGGGLAAVFQGLTAGTRGLSTLTTGGLGNAAVSTVEAGTSLLLSLAAVAAPVLALGLLAVLLYLAAARIVRGARRREPS